ncbi:MAG: cytochrome C oxidase subunit IV family protein [Albidovulum sp.]
MTVTRAWLLLLALSAASTALALTADAGAWFVIAVLTLAGVKARLILSSYLGLAAAPAIRAVFDAALAALLLLFAGLAIAA